MRSDHIVVDARMAQLQAEAADARLGHEVARPDRRDPLGSSFGGHHHRGPIEQARQWTGRRLVRLGLAMLDARLDRSVVATSSGGRGR